MDDVDSYSPPKKFRESGDQDALIGKRQQLSMAARREMIGSNLSSVYEDASLTPFAGDAINSMIVSSEMKPYRNVIKRYWTEDEVNLSFA